jgi:predicted RND superfamily exporter protein
VAANGHALNAIFLSRTNNFSALEPVIDNLAQAAPPPPGLSIAPGGVGVVGVGLLENLSKSRTLLTYLAAAFVGTFLAIRLRSIIRSLLSLIPVLIAVGAVSLVAYGLNVKLSPLTVVSGPLVVAICTEFTSLILLRFVEERNRGLTPRAAMTVTASRTGRAFLVSAMTAVGGMAVIATSSMPMLRDFGIVMALNVAVALLSALIVPPPILVWAEGHGWVTRGLLRPVPDPIEFESPHSAVSHTIATAPVTWPQSR